jgi:transposase-like protein
MSVPDSPDYTAEQFNALTDGQPPLVAPSIDRLELPRRVKVRSSQYLNLIKQDHRRVKQRIRPMLGFKRFDHAVVTISGIELAEKIKKRQFKTGKPGGAEATMSELWNAALAA